jgi:hypothetical protein
MLQAEDLILGLDYNLLDEIVIADAEAMSGEIIKIVRYESLYASWRKELDHNASSESRILLRTVYFVFSFQHKNKF